MPLGPLPLISTLPRIHCPRPQIKRNTRLRDDEWSDVEEDEREAKVAKKGGSHLLNRASFLAEACRALGPTVDSLVALEETTQSSFCPVSMNARIFKVMIGWTFCAEHFEPEDKALKASLDSLRKQIKETSARVSEQRKKVPELLKQQVHQGLEKAAAALDSALVTSASDAQPKPKTPLTVSKRVGEAFVQDSLDIARRTAALQKSLPEQVTKGKSTVKMCQEWSRKPLSTAEALMTDRPAASGKSPGAARRGKGAAVQALRGRQPH